MTDPNDLRTQIKRMLVENLMRLIWVRRSFGSVIKEFRRQS